MKSPEYDTTSWHAAASMKARVD